MNMIPRITLPTALVLAASPAFAASIPQMDKTSYAGQLVWLGISFVLLYAVVSLFIAPRVSGVLDTRRKAIDDAIAKAEELKATAASTRGNFEAAGAEARAKAAAIIAEAQADVSKKATEANTKLTAELDAKALASRQEISKAVAKAQLEVDDAAQSLAASMSAKLLATDMPVAAKQTKKAS